jgi:hypothetical protein
VYAPELTLKRIELLKDTLPSLALVGVLRNVQNTGGMRQLREAEKAGEALGAGCRRMVRVNEGTMGAATALRRYRAATILEGDALCCFRGGLEEAQSVSRRTLF